MGRATGQVIVALGNYRHHSIAFSPDASQLALGTAKGEILVRAVAGGAEETILRQSGGGPIYQLKYDPSVDGFWHSLIENSSLSKLGIEFSMPWSSAGEGVRDFGRAIFRCASS